MTLQTHNPQWREIFEKEKKLLQTIFNDELLDIQHIGSTAISQIKAKPIIDIAVLIKNFKDAKSFFNKLKDLGYKYSIKRSSSERYFFTKGTPIKYHLSIANSNTDYLERQILFRDYLIQHSEMAKKYELLKTKLIKKYPSGTDEYSHGKSLFINEVIMLATKSN